MSEKYTRGEMVFEDKRPSCNGFSLFVGDQYVAFIGDSDSVTDAMANSERMAACWNACQGIDTADLNAGSVSIIQKMHDEAAKRVLAQREAAAAQTALKPVSKPLCRDCADFGPICPTTGLPCDGSGEKP